MTAGERQAFDPDVTTEQRATVKAPLEPLELRQRRPPFAVHHAEAADAELAGGEADVERLDGDRAPGAPPAGARSRVRWRRAGSIPVESGRHQGAEERPVPPRRPEHPTPDHESQDAKDVRPSVSDLLGPPASRYPARHDQRRHRSRHPAPRRAAGGLRLERRRAAGDPAPGRGGAARCCCTSLEAVAVGDIEPTTHYRTV